MLSGFAISGGGHIVHFPKLRREFAVALIANALCDLGNTVVRIQKLRGGVLHSVIFDVRGNGVAVHRLEYLLERGGIHKKSL